jgi:hypothetical protein
MSMQVMEEPTNLKYGQQVVQLHWAPDYTLKALTDLIYLKMRSVVISCTKKLKFQVVL